MLKGEQIICLSSIDWAFNWQGHQEIMSRFAAAGNAVLYIENTGVRMPGWRDWPRLSQRLKNWRSSQDGIQHVQDNLHICSPLLLPFPHSAVAQRLNRHLFLGSIRRWSQRLGYSGQKRPLVWTFLPTQFALEVIRELQPEHTIYYCLADFEQLGPARKVRRAETALLRRADTVFAQGQALAQRCQRAHSHEIPIYPCGVNVDRFQPGQVLSIPEDLKRIPGPRIGYVGALHRHLNVPLMQALAQRNPTWQFVFVGPTAETDPKIWQRENIHLLGPKPHEAIPNYLAGFDACLIPYLLTDYTQTVYPTKLNEYLMLGKPVISTPLAEVVAFNQQHGDIIALANSTETFETCIREALNQGPRAHQDQIRIAQQADWGSRVEAMSQVVEARLEEGRQARCRVIS